MLKQIRQWLSAHPNWTLTFITIAALAPFLAKPFNIDDPLFIWAAKQIQAHPLNPYGFDVNWYGVAQPMWSVTENPPLASYFIALAAAVLGWSEIALHTAFLLPAIAVILGTYRLAKKLCNQPMLAALATLFTPVLLVSSTTVMCDVLMLAFWVWAIVFWMEGMESGHNGQLAAAGLLTALALLSKYFGVCLVPLLAAHGLVHQRRLGRWTFFLLIPLATVVTYQLATLALYGHALFVSAAGYTAFAKGVYGYSKASAFFTALAFTGGGVATALFFAPLLWRLRTLAMLIAGTILLGLVLTFIEKFSSPTLSFNASAEIQIIVWAIGGTSLLALAAVDFFQKRDASSCLLAFWVGGTFLFTAVMNWTVNGRSILPMVPAAAILIIRRLDERKLAQSRGVNFAMTASALLALLVTRADFLQASAIRQVVQQALIKYAQTSGTIWFQGHWGFQFYMQSFGASAVDLQHPRLKPEDKVVLPQANTNVLPLNSETTTLLDTFTAAGPKWLATWSPDIDAGFYASSRGALPFAFGRVPPERVSVYLLKPIATK